MWKVSRFVRLVSLVFLCCSPHMTSPLLHIFLCTMPISSCELQHTYTAHRCLLHVGSRDLIHLEGHYAQAQSALGWWLVGLGCTTICMSASHVGWCCISILGAECVLRISWIRHGSLRPTRSALTIEDQSPSLSHLLVSTHYK